MSAAEVSYYLMLFALAMLTIVTCAVLVTSLFELYSRWGVRLGYRRGYYKGQPIRMFGVAFIEKKISQMPTALLVIGMVAAMLLVPFGALGFNHVRKLSPEQFVQEFQESQKQSR